ncbi:hypothetical protein JA9_004309 [Meyerozyma sp. JA9]|nr:hypothetical protein JA9_004309 [Meyerozyma sp. JA9]
MTVYQQGAPMEGWNDCPAVIPRPPMGKRKASRSRRVGMDRSPSAELPAPAAAETRLKFSSTDSLGSLGENEGPGSEALDLEKLEKMYQNSSLSAKDVENCRKRIASLQGHEGFVNEIARRSLHEPAAVVNQSILDYMATNDNVGPGCLSLRKLVESQPT